MNHLDELRERLLDDQHLVRGIASGRQRHATTSFRRVELRYVDLRAGRRLQVTAYDDTQAHTRNLEPGAAAQAEVDGLLATGFSSWHVESADETLQLRLTKKGRPLLQRSASAQGSVDHAHDRAKRRMLPESDMLFKELGITTAAGEVKPSRRAKFHQVQDFLSALDPVVDTVVDTVVDAAAEPAAVPERPLRLADLGCGNAYLTFAAVRYLSVVRGLQVKATGVDVKTQARAHNERIAGSLDLSTRLDFVDSTIADVRLDPAPDLVLALHACDTATDEALARAVGWRTPVVVAAPCCHHDIQRQLANAGAPEPYQLLTRHGILRERFADVLTDALRAAILRIVGYRVDVIEFVDRVHTPRNTLIRAVRTDAAPDPATVEAYWRIVTEWKLQPALATLLAPIHPELGPADVETLT